MVNECRESGQATVEYILLLSIVVSFFLIAAKAIQRHDLMGKLGDDLMKPFRATYQYGHPKAEGWERGTPKFHPRAPSSLGNGNFRIFINPGTPSENDG